MIMAFVVYFFSVMFCQGVTELKVSESESVTESLDELYGSIPRAFYTLFAAACTGIDWNEAFAPLSNMPKHYSFLFLLYISFILFGVSNVVTAVFVESAMMTAQYSRDLLVQERQQAKEAAVVHMKELFMQMDVDGSGELSAEEMEHFLGQPDLASYIDALEIRADNTRTLFRLLDTDDSGNINIDEFCDGCLRLQGEAKSMDVHTMIFQVRRFLTKWSEFTAYVEEALDVAKDRDPSRKGFEKRDLAVPRGPAFDDRVTEV